MIKGGKGVTEMTVKTETVCNRLLSSGGKGELIVIGYSS